MILIATDEAGYGPKLGPLVIAASAWKLPKNTGSQQDLASAFCELSRPVTVGKRRIVVNDSKAVFKPKSSGSSGDAGYSKLEIATLAGSRWCGLATDHLTLLSDLAPRDIQSVVNTPWLKQFSEQSVATGPASELTDHWRAGQASLQWFQSRVITANEFNRCCESGMNKSDLLSDTTLGLVKSMLDRCNVPADEPVLVFCDRHGGRRYYAGPLQSTFGGTLVQVISESKSESRYVVPYGGREFDIRFSVKGDSFTPVAFSSMVAKYLREKAMESLNSYFHQLHTGTEPLRPTAGYPVDADRFLKSIQPILKRVGIDHSRLVRSR